MTNNPNGRPKTPLTREDLQTAAYIMAVTCKETGLSLRTLVSDTHTRKVALARHVTAWAVRQHTDLAYRQIGWLIGQSVQGPQYGVRKVRECRDYDPEMDELATTVEEAITETA